MLQKKDAILWPTLGKAACKRAYAAQGELAPERAHRAAYTLHRSARARTDALIEYVVRSSGLRSGRSKSKQASNLWRHREGPHES